MAKSGDLFKELKKGMTPEWVLLVSQGTADAMGTSVLQVVKWNE